MWFISRLWLAYIHGMPTKYAVLHAYLLLINYAVFVVVALPYGVGSTRSDNEVPWPPGHGYKRGYSSPNPCHYPFSPVLHPLLLSSPLLRRRISVKFRQREDVVRRLQRWGTTIDSHSILLRMWITIAWEGNRLLIDQPKPTPHYVINTLIVIQLRSSILRTLILTINTVEQSSSVICNYIILIKHYDYNSRQLEWVSVSHY